MGVPVMAPVEALSVNPVGRDGETLQFVLVPPELVADRVGIASFTPRDRESEEFIAVTVKVSTDFTRSGVPDISPF